MAVPEPTILLVEDSHDDVVQLKRAFRQASLGGTLQVVGDGAEAMEYLSGTGPYVNRAQFPLPSLILLDLALPRRSGVEVLTWLGQEPTLRHVPVVVLTASRDPASIALAYELGACSCLVKPVNREALTQVVNTHLLPLNRPLVALVASGDPGCRQRVLAELQREFAALEVREAGSATELQAMVEAGGFDVVVTGTAVAGGTGVDVLRAVRTRWLACPVLLVAATVTDRELMDALRSGLDDLILDTPQHLMRLASAVRAAVGRALDRKALREAEARYRTLVEQIPAITYTASLDAVGHLTFVSPQVAKLGYTPDEVKADPELFVRQLHPEDRERVLAEGEHSRATGEPLRREYRLLTRAGHELYFSDEATVMRDDAGQPHCLHGVLLDITERKRAEGMAKTSAERFRALAALAPAGIFLADAEGNCFWVNERWCELTGISAEEAAWTGWIRTVHAEDRDRVVLEWYGAAAEGRDFAAEYRLQPTGNQVRWVAARGKAVRHSDGGVAGYVGVILEIAAPHPTA